MHVWYPNFQNTACSAFHPSQETSLQGANSSPALDAKDNFSLVFLFLKISPTAPWSEPRNSLSGEFPYRFLNVHPSGYSSSTPHPPPPHPTTPPPNVVGFIKITGPTSKYGLKLSQGYNSRFLYNSNFLANLHINGVQTPRAL